jgi:hypothetical protein
MAADPRCKIFLDQMREARAKGASTDVHTMMLNHLNCPVKHLSGLGKVGGKKKCAKGRTKRGTCRKVARRTRSRR